MNAPIGFSVQPLPGWLRVANDLMPRVTGAHEDLDPGRLMTLAGRAAGLPPDFPPHVAGALDVYCRSLREEANLHWFGVMNCRTMLVGGLAVLLQVEDLFARQPELAETPLLDPVVVTGLPRSGTTHLHRLLSAVAEAEPVPFYRHIYPVRRGALDVSRWRTEVEFLPWQLASRSYEMDAMHLVRPALPDECNLGMRLGGRSMIYWATAPAYTYLDWLLSQDLRETYLLYRKVLILHQLATPGRRLTLKCPHHMAWLPALAEALPEAHVVMTHRDPVKAVPSECKLVLAIQGLSTDALDWRRTVAGNALKIRVFSERGIAFSDGPMARRVFHVPYRDLLSDPVGLVGRIHTRFGLPFDEADAAKVRGYAQDNTQHKHGRNHYTAEQFGLSPERLLQEHAPYRERFREEIGL